MKLSLIHLLASIAPLAAVAGCAVAPGTSGAPEESTASASSAMASSGIGGTGGIVVNSDPTALCSAVSAYSVLVPVFPNQTISGGEGNAANACDYMVTEITGTAGKALDLVLTAVQPNYPTGPYQNMWALTQQDCSSSYWAYDVFGFVPPRFNFVNSHITVVPGYWETIKQGSTNATYLSNGMCRLPGLDSYGMPIFTSSDVTPYTTIRAATKAYAGSPNGTHQIPLYLMVRP